MGVVLVLAQSTASAQDADPFASLNEEQIARMVELMELGGRAEANASWAEALEIYQEMHSIVAVEEYRFRQGVCLQELGSYEDALAVFSELTESTDEEISLYSQQRAGSIQALLTAPVTIRFVSDPAGARILVGDIDYGPTLPDGLNISLTPGEYAITCELTGYQSHTADLEVLPMQDDTVYVALLPAEEDVAELPPEPPVEVEPAGRSLALPLTFGGLAVASLATGVACGMVSRTHQDEYNNYDFTKDGAHGDELDGLAEDAQKFANIANIGYGAAGLFAAGAVLTFFLMDGDDEPEDDTPVVFSPAFSPSYVGAGLSVSF